MWSSKLRLRLGSKTPTCLFSLVLAILMGSSRSESFETTTASSYSPLESVQQQVGRQIDVGPLLLGVQHLDGARAGLRLPCQGPPLPLGKEASVVDGQVGDGLKGAEISLLPLRLGGVIGPVGDEGGESSVSGHVVMGQQQPRQLPDVQPAMGRAPQGAVVEIEAVDVYVGSNDGGPSP